MNRIWQFHPGRRPVPSGGNQNFARHRHDCNRTVAGQKGDERIERRGVALLQGTDQYL